MDSISLLQPDGLVVAPFFSQVAVVPPTATTIYVGGQNAVDETGALVGGDDAAAQTKRVYANLGTALAAAGAGFGDLVSVSVLVVGGVDIEAAYGVAAEAMGGLPKPPLVTLARVAGLARPGALVEVSAIAAVQR